jgi:predicted metal-dependent hydrolase
MSRSTSKPTTVTIRHGAEVFDVAITYTAGDRLSITVHPDQRVTVRAPAGRPWEAVLVRIRARAPWIVRQRSMFAAHKPQPARRQYVSGETHLYMGRQYRLRVRPGREEQVVMRGGYIHVTVAKSSDKERVRQLLDAWYRDRAALILGRRLDACYDLVRSLGISKPALHLRTMRKRWGSCTKTARILLNPELIKVPGHCIDYVIVHELCHLKVLKHDRAFIRLLARYLPDWQRRKTRLDAFVLPEQ